LAGTETAAGAKPGAEAGKKKKPNTTNSGF
jgi:hypothetical protein